MEHARRVRLELIVRPKFHPLDPLHEKPERDASFKPSQRSAWTDVGPLTKCEVLLGRAVQIERIRVSKHLRISVGRREAQEYPSTSPDISAAEFGPRQACSDHELCRRVQAERFLNYAIDESEIATDTFKSFLIKGEAIQHVPNELARFFGSAPD